MNAEHAAALVRRWVSRYTRELPDEVAGRRAEEVSADLDDHLDHGRRLGLGERRLAAEVLSRMVRGVAADASWRLGQLRANLDHPPALRAAVRTSRRAYGSGLGLSLFAAFFLFYVVGALGLIGSEGDIADRLYLGVFATFFAGAVVVRLRPRGMARTLQAMALVQTAIALAAVLAGKHQEPVTSLPELLGLNAMFVAMFLSAAWLFAQAARVRPPGGRTARD